MNKNDELLIKLLEYFREGAFPPSQEDKRFESYTAEDIRAKYIAAYRAGLLIQKGRTRDARYKTSDLGLKLLE